MHAREQMFRKVYHKAREVYGRIPGYEDHDARLTADAAADGWFARDGFLGIGGYRKRSFRGLARMPAPGNLLNLGDFTELEWVTSAGVIQGISFAVSDHVPLLWSHKLQALFIVPGTEIGPCELPPRRTEDYLARVWAKGRPAACSSKARIEPGPLRFVAPGIQVSYSSDKFTHGVAKPYIHHFGTGVLCYFSHDPIGSSRAPDVMIRGGRLRLTEHGIDG